MIADGSVEVTGRGPVALITLRREDKLNALSTHMERELARVLDDEIVRSSRAVVITGGARVFSSGADADELRELTPRAIADYYRGSGAVYETFAALEQPTIAAVAGSCLGGGLELALAADLRVVDATAVLGLPEVGLGIVPSSGYIHRIVRAVGPARARDLILSCRRLCAKDALAWGLVSEVCTEGNHIDRALELAAEIADLPPLAVSIAKQAITAATDAPRETALLVERLAYGMLHRNGESSPVPA